MSFPKPALDRHLTHTLTLTLTQHISWKYPTALVAAVIYRLTKCQPPRTFTPKSPAKNAYDTPTFTERWWKQLHSSNPEQRTLEKDIYRFCWRRRKHMAHVAVYLLWILWQAVRIVSGGIGRGPSSEKVLESLLLVGKPGADTYSCSHHESLWAGNRRRMY